MRVADWMLDTSIFTLRYFLRRSLFLRHPLCHTFYIYNWYAFTRLVQVYKFWKQNAWFFISVIHYLVIHYLVFITLSLFCPLLWTCDELFQESGSLTPLCMYSCVINVSACQTNIFYRNIYHLFYAVLLFTIHWFTLWITREYGVVWRGWHVLYFHVMQLQTK